MVTYFFRFPNGFQYKLFEKLPGVFKNSVYFFLCINNPDSSSNTLEWKNNNNNNNETSQTEIPNARHNNHTEVTV